MQMNEYLEKSGRTAAPPVGHMSVFDNDNKVMMRQAVDLVVSGNMADTMKRAMFYNTSIEKIRERAHNATKMHMELFQQIDAKTDQFDLTSFDLDILHAIFGVISEAGEILEELMKAKLEGREVNRVNMIEEVGDIMWYLALALRANGGSFEDACTRNINKLAVRYPEQFSEHKAENRDLDAEQKELSA